MLRPVELNFTLLLLGDFSMPVMTTFADFLPAFFAVFTPSSFRGADFPGYLDRPANQRTDDEASIVDTAVVIPLLGLLGFAPGEQAYNRQKHGDRPDFAPENALYGTCFVVEDKATALPLDFDMSNPSSHLAQLARYARAGGLRIGLLTNGARLTAWRFDDPDTPQSLIDFDVLTAISAWKVGGEAAVTASTIVALRLLFDTFRQNAFTDQTAWNRKSPSIWKRGRNRLCRLPPTAAMKPNS